MICQECNERPATMHFTKIINGEKTEVHLCQHCAQENGNLFMMGAGQGFSINNLLAGLLNINQPYQQQTPFKPETVLQCPHCSMTYPQFVKVGRFGCADCYDTFSEQLIPILRRLHSGNSIHKGKIPKKIGGSLHLRKKLEELRGRLREFILAEEFEKAAGLRDEIRSLEKQMDQTQGGGE